MTDRAQQAITALARVLEPPDALRQQQAVSMAIDNRGQLTRRTVAPHLPPQGMDFSPGDTGRQRVKRAGVLSLVAVWCATAPTTGSGATVTVTQATETDPTGTSVLVQMNIPVGQKMRETSPMVLVPAGAWIGATVVTPAGSSGVSISLTIQGGG